MRVLPMSFSLALMGAFTACSSLPPIDEVNPTRFGFAAAFVYDDTDTTVNGAKVGNEETTAFVIDTVAGHRVNDGIFEPGILLAWERVDTELTDFVGSTTGDLTTDALSFGANLRIWFLTSGNVRPWVEGAGGLLLARAESGGVTEDATGYFFQGRVGVSTFVSESVSVDLSLRGAGRSVSVDDIDVDFDTTEIALFAGISTYF
jgi:hypothetical protein